MDSYTTSWSNFTGALQDAFRPQPDPYVPEFDLKEEDPEEDSEDNDPVDDQAMAEVEEP